MRENVSDRRLGPFRSKDSLDLKEKKEKWCEVGERGEKGLEPRANHRSVWEVNQWLSFCRVRLGVAVL